MLLQQQEETEEEVEVEEEEEEEEIKSCCLQSKAAEPYMRLCGVDREDLLRCFLFIEGPSLYHQGAQVQLQVSFQLFNIASALRVLSYLPLPYSALNTLLVVLTPLRDIVYDYVAKRRYNWFGKEDDCLVLREKELLERFINWEEMPDGGRCDL
ncbi:Uncharacterized protein YuxK [Camellia lanceoleosa]|uniref:Uncharacterized protein YuxK n=1 Tax=Camellia lanceoleosa TaxID=1840588 RepID=A0ACC0GDQ7_9ERIC|nr:Uncharacterized protein YuxK [Camellia lanceoleosa]